MNLSILSNINIDPLKGQLIKQGFDNVHFAGYNQFLFELINPNSELNTKSPKFVFFHLDGEELFKSTLTNSSKIFDKETFNSFIYNIEIYALNNPNTNIIISGIFLSSFSIYTHLNRNTEISINKIQDSANLSIEKLAKKHSNIFYFDFPALISIFGTNSFIDEKFWYLGRIKYTNTAFLQIAKQLKSLIDAINGKTKKVLVLDLDNTLWGGIIGEDGINGIILSEDGIGKIYREFQKHIKHIQSIGILLAICSKNNESDANEVFESHKMMVLSNNDFVARKINWNNKADNIKLIAKELDLGLDSFVFIDDNPVERQLVRENIPQITVPEFPKDIDQLNKWFISEVVYPFFSKVNLTKEDKNKTKQYERNIKRKSLESTLDLNDYIKSLNIKLSISIDDKNQISRISQLTQKTNQFNLSTKRYTENEIDSFINDKLNHIFTAEYWDKYGNEGIISVAIVNIIDKKVNIDTFLMSCRVIGRYVEFDFLQNVIDILIHKYNIETISADFFPTTKNILAKEFYEKCGFLTNETKPLSKDELILNILKNKK